MRRGNKKSCGKDYKGRERAGVKEELRRRYVLRLYATTVYYMQLYGGVRFGDIDRPRRWTKTKQTTENVTVAKETTRVF